MALAMPHDTSLLRLSAGSRRSRGPSILNGDHRDAVTELIELVDDQHPAPWTQNEAQTGPATRQLWPQTRELLERRERPPDTFASVGR